MVEQWLRACEWGRSGEASVGEEWSMSGEEWLKAAVTAIHNSSMVKVGEGLFTCEA